MNARAGNAMRPTSRQSVDLTWEQKLDLLNTIAPAEVKMRKPGDWYVSHALDVGGDGFLTGTYGNGRTPEEAVEEHWLKLVVELPPEKYLVAWGKTRHHYRWAGHRFEEVA